MSERENAIRIAVADDHPVVREGLVAMLRTEPDFDVVGEAGTGPDALTLVAKTRPRVLLLDLEMPGMDGVGVLRALQAERSETRVIVFTVFDTDDRIIAAVEAGAAGYLLKGAPRAEVFAAVRTVAAGGSLLAPVAAQAVMRRVRGGGPTLTPREREVLDQLARGLGNKRIAATLGMAERTVKYHLGSIFAKLGARNRTDAVARAAEAGLIALRSG
ncbi:MAG TPA: response regulator transcription factor [Longimicrobium sp.]|jgi:DNA-binding NarL/FixJ family response regulator